MPFRSTALGHALHGPNSAGMAIDDESVCLVFVIHRLPAGVGSALAAASAAGKLALFDFSLDFRVPFTFWAGLVGGSFLTLATHGTDHYLVQRLLVARSQKDASSGNG